MGTKILHVSDTHLGKKQYGSEIRRRDYSVAFDATIDIAINDDVDAVIHTGDLFDDRSPDTESVSNAFKSIKRLSDAGIPFLGIVGNHERKWNSQWLDIYENFENVHRLNTNPFVVNNEVSVYGYDSIRDNEWEEMEFDLKKTDDGNSIVLCMHELFVELMSPNKADRSVKSVINRLNIKPDLMPLGDYHSAVEQEVEGVPVFYAGATERTSATKEDPTVRILEFEDGAVKNNSWRKVEGAKEGVPRPFYIISVNLTDSTKRSQIRNRINETVTDNELNDSVIVINVEGSKESPISSSEIYEIMENMNVLVPYVSDKRTPEIMDLDSDNTSDPESINIDEMIREEIDDDISNTVEAVENNIVRDMTVSKSNIRDIIGDQFNSMGDQNED